MRNCIRTELWKATHNWMFVISLMVGMVFCIADVAQNIVALREYNETIQWIIDTGLNMSLSPIGYSLFTRWIAISGATYGSIYFYLIWPILAALPYGWSYFQERQTGVYHQIVGRVGRRTYFVSKYAAVFVSGGIAVALPVMMNLLLNALVCPVCMPKVTARVVAIFDGYFLSELYYTNPWIYAAVWCAMEFLFGGTAACLCLTVGTKLRHQAMVVLMPFALLCVLEGAINVVIKPALVRIHEFNLELSPLLLAQASSLNANPEWYVFTVLGLLFVITAGVGYWQVVKHELA